jgi:Flp pilus assembly protein TadG
VSAASRRRVLDASGRERGTVTLFLLGLCLMMLALGGVSLDLWRSFSARRALAAAADAAALAGASMIDEDRYRRTGVLALVPERAADRARASMAAQLDQGTRTSSRVRATTEYVTVVVEGSVEFTLLGLLGTGDFGIEVASTAVPRRSR